MLREQSQKPETIIKIGYVAVVAASLSRWFLHPRPHFGEGLVDASQGFLYGIAIGAMLLGVWRRGRKRDGASCDSSHA